MNASDHAAVRQQLYDNLIVVTNRHLYTKPFKEQLLDILKGKPKAIILREKDLNNRTYTALAKDVSTLCRKKGVPFIIHNHIAAAEALGVKNLQLPYGKAELIPSIRKQFSLIGVSVHSVLEAAEADRLGADYLIAGHIFATDCKRGLAPRGLDFLKSIVSCTEKPVYAIGGINESNYEEVLSAGARGYCMMSGVV